MPYYCLCNIILYVGRHPYIGNLTRLWVIGLADFSLSLSWSVCCCWCLVIVGVLLLLVSYYSWRLIIVGLICGIMVGGLNFCCLIIVGGIIVVFNIVILLAVLLLVSYYCRLHYWRYYCWCLITVCAHVGLSGGIVLGVLLILVSYYRWCLIIVCVIIFDMLEGIHM